jgi:hypothetical protein
MTGGEAFCLFLVASAAATAIAVRLMFMLPDDEEDW